MPSIFWKNAMASWIVTASRPFSFSFCSSDKCNSSCTVARKIRNVGPRAWTSWRRASSGTGAGSLRVALDTDAGRFIAAMAHAPTPEFALLEIAFASRSTNRVDVELAQIRMTHQQPGQVVRQSEASAGGVGERLGQLALHVHR